jgi:IS30 family transposase
LFQKDDLESAAVPSVTVPTDKIVDKINNRSRKVLGYLTPYEVFSP